MWAEQRVPSGLAALLAGVTPVWTAMFEWRQGGAAPSVGTVTGLIAGLTGVALLVAPGQFGSGAPVSLPGAAACMLSSIGWSLASVLSPGRRLPSSPAIASSLLMLCGGALLVTAGLVTGEGAEVHLDAISPRSVLALAYLIVFGSLVAFTAFTWLLRVSTPSRVATCAYVNPVVAVLLGWAVAGERLTIRILIAAAIIIGAVVLITTARSRRPGDPQSGPVTEPESEVV